ncbi:MAG: trehalose-6-phosphate synthase [Planctomycetota bacterium]
MASPRVIIVANRLPVRRVKHGSKSVWETSPGGLVTAVEPTLRDTGGSWVGWPGTSGKAPDPFTLDGIHMVPVPISKAELENFYEGFSNALLWPLYHDAIRPSEIHRRWWWPYVEINRRFAAAAAAELKPGDVCWVHDYQLHLVPQMIREQRPDVRIGFFLHIPFPAEELFARIPWRREILSGMLGADIIGFQTKLGVKNFTACVRRYMDVEASGSTFTIHGRKSRAKAYAISIDVDQFERVAAKEEVATRRDQIREKMAGDGRKVILGIDRLDYTKGIDYRLRAIAEVLRRERFSAADFAFIQVAVPSRENVDDYVAMRSQIEELVGRINGHYGEPGLFPIHYVRRNLALDELVAYYRAADIMLVTPLRDGMNLVAKEYPATRLDNTGTLILSEFAGAAHELRRAVLVNPFDVDGIATAIETALTMPAAESKRRMTAVRAAIRRNTVYDWAGSFLKDLTA